VKLGCGQTRSQGVRQIVLGSFDDIWEGEHQTTILQESW